MTIKPTNWNCFGHTLPMFETPEHGLCCTPRNYCVAAGMSEVTLRRKYMDYRDELDCLTVHDLNAKEFLYEHRELFGLQRVRDDGRIITEDDVCTLTVLSRSPMGKRFRSEFRAFVKAHAIRETVPIEKYQALERKNEEQARNHEYELQAMEARVRAEIAGIKRDYEEIRPILKAVASASGKSLSAQRQIKKLYN